MHFVKHCMASGGVIDLEVIDDIRAELCQKHGCLQTYKALRPYFL